MFKIIVNLYVVVVFFLIKKSISAQNQAPKFDPPLQPNYFFPEYDAIKPGDLLLWLNATDSDDSDLDFGVEGDYVSKLITINKVNGKNAKVIAKAKFDREVQEKYENIVFYVKDKPGNKIYQSVRFIIMDIDDNPPVFKNTPYKINIIENQPVDTVIFDGIEAFDADGPLYNKFTFTLLENEYFAIDKTQFVRNGLYTSKLILKKQLNYEKFKNYILKLNAIGENSAHTSTTEILVNVIDYPDRKPEFSQSPYYVRIPEEMNIGEPVLQVSAKDGDSGINNPCKYEIIKNLPDSDYFTINSQTGLISVNKIIDLESDDLIKSGGLLEINVMATEIGDESSFETTKVTIAVLDINDNDPKFNKKSYNLSISPKCVEGTSLTLVENDIETIHVYDPDKGSNGSFSLSVAKIINHEKDSIDYDYSIDYEITPKIALNDANLIIKLKNSSNLFKNIGKTQHFHIIAKDNGIDGKTTTSDVFIKIENINEHGPEFEKKIYTLLVDENSPFNTTVGYLQAYDNDTFGDYGKIYYELKNGQDRFQIEKVSGRVYTISDNPTVQLDRESIDTFYMSVEAIDGGGLRTSVQLIIKLNDLNDNAPQFTNNLKNKIDSNNYLIAWIEENSSKWLEQVKIQAFDRDKGKNGMIEYEIIEGDCFKDYFTINNKTQKIELKDNLTLDFEQIFYYKQKNYFHSKTMPNQYSNFVLNPGEIDINLIIQAKDLGTPSLSSNIIVKIVIKDLNDNKPKFDQPFYTAQLLETARYGEIIQVNAIDLDAPNTANSKVIYSIETGNKEKFSIDSTNGLITINENANLDRDLYGSVYKLKIVANDFESLNSKNKVKNTDENYCFVIIEIIDVNDKKPKFVNNLDMVSIEENVPLNTHVYQIKAFDTDSNSKLNYFLIENDSKYEDQMMAFDGKHQKIDIKLVKDWFEINPQNGSIYTKENIDREIAETVELVIGVEDLNAAENFKPQIITRPQSNFKSSYFRFCRNDTKLKIKIIDVNDNFPLFPELKQLNSGQLLNENEEPIFEVYESIDENSKIKTRIIQLKAVDKDKDNKITYKIVSMNDPNKGIMIDKYSGEVYVNGLIDYETIKWINLTILANDNGRPIQKHSIINLHCKINDLNDNAPRIVAPNHTEFEFYENNQENYFITQINAIDLDSDLYGPINFKILNSNDEKFEIEPLSGRLYAKKSLDREEKSYYNLVIEARDNPYGLTSNQLTDSINIKINILDQNDNSPKCEQDIYKIEVSQNADIGSFLYQVKGIDYDIGSNSNLTYSLQADNLIDPKNELFQIEKFSGIIKNFQKLIGFSGSLKYKLTINDRAGQDGSLSESCPIEIMIKDANIHSPQFVFPNKNNSIFRVKASLNLDSEILTIKAVDKDTGINGEVFYYLDESRLKNTDWKNFKIDQKMGLLTLKSPLDINYQSLYSIDVIASDYGKPDQLKTRLTLTFILVDDENNSAKFEKNEICLLENFTCDKVYQTVVVKIKEEQDPENVQVNLGLAKMGDINKSNKDVCYYLLGKDKDLFEISLKMGILKPRDKLDRETKDKYELILKSSEYCNCIDDASKDGCKFLTITHENFNPNDPSLIRLKIDVDDINDNKPKFDRKFYQIGITSDIDFGDIILESSVSDLDLKENLILTIDNSSILTNSPGKNFPFSLEFFEKLANKRSIKNRIHETKFTIKLSKNFNPKLESYDRNTFYQFNLTVTDQTGLNSTCKIQIIFINKQQRVKLVFSQPIEKVLKFQDEFKNYVSNLTGLRAFIDKVRIHRSVNASNSVQMTEILMHFVEPKSELFRLDSNFRQINPEYIIIDSESILNILDRSKDSNLLKKYKLSLAEKFDYQGLSTYYRYGSDTEENYGGFFLLSTATNPKFYTKFIIPILFGLLILSFIFLLVICFCTRIKYKRKLKAERALSKAFGFEQRSLAYSEPIGGYLNHAFDSNSLLPIPGTNMYAYEGSNPMWLKKYDKMECSNKKSSSGSSSSSSSSTTSESTSYSQFSQKNENFLDSVKNQEISSFYLKQIDSPSTNFSPVSTSNNSDKNSGRNETMSSEILSDISPNHTPSQSKEVNSVSSFKTENNLLTFAPTQNKIPNLNNQTTKSEVFSFKEQIRLISSQRMKFSNIDETPNIENKVEKILFPNNVSSFTKIFDNSQTIQQQDAQTDNHRNSIVQSKDLSDMFAVESTSIKNRPNIITCSSNNFSIDSLANKKYFNRSNYNLNQIIHKSHFSSTNTLKMRVEQVSVPVPWGDVKCQIFGDPTSKKAKPIVCLHGYLDNSNSFKPLAPYFCQSDEYYMIAVDLPGHGLSSKLPNGIPYTPKLFLAAVRRVIRHFNLKEFYFFCHSYGIHLSVMYDIVFSHEVKALVSIDWVFAIPGYKVESYAHMWRLGIDGLIDIEKDEKNKNESTSNKSLTKELAVSILMKANNHLDEESAKILIDRALVTREDGKLDFSRDIRVKQTVGVVDHYIDMIYLLPEMRKNLKAPWLVIHADPPSYGERAGEITTKFIKDIEKESNTKIQYETFKGTHHFHMIYPKETAEIIYKFLDNLNTKESNSKL
ncbi:unnamed protein product [Brachionus calyciflorus]|uniref:Cadherin domain-containing protein n=1 Tax=Brachionus calyciflorus TaxID=104777 RepID=A0A813ZL21_9BILA|nr:unnamed protein product [Brachionus calyciflorus]